MALFNGYLTVTRALGVFALAFGVLGFGVTYWWMPIYLPEYQSGLLLCGLLVIGGTALLAASRAARKESRASLITLAACSLMVVALLAATSGDVATRLWFETVIQFS